MLEAAVLLLLGGWERASPFPQQLLITPPWDATAPRQGHACTGATPQDKRWSFWSAPAGEPPPGGWPIYVEFQSQPFESDMFPHAQNDTCGSVAAAEGLRAPAPPGPGSCCFFSGGATCANHPAAMCPNVPACATEPACTGACNGHPEKSTWCPSASCTGTPEATISWVADGACHQAAANVCSGQPGSPPTCSYSATVMGQTTFNLGGIWAGVGCTGKQTQAPVTLPLNICAAASASSKYHLRVISIRPES
eukprot:COSAG01_NODE_3648_length_5827_cov_4.766934_6_plen_251_part_00